ncbi:putative CYC2-like cyclin putative G1 cyclin CycE4 [Leptomonas seymouri]|uniref:Putative CYC2-like cyclin putative G1 cyclin CycE4 n=1 Tax=Leptomonas seymouri TaxID=5684 RepID=A0A0N1HTR5_LEPSE|nr:putative CYC2-like cyclin putative G1 cyclin CycE4 [Leptomonas seymouri]|eukprot:KPI84481.1 putative CYC2-like cyclin putative G1 cyclin CycE4 [Leptomonas seymouri]
MESLHSRCSSPERASAQMKSAVHEYEALKSSYTPYVNKEDAKGADEAVENVDPSNLASHHDRSFALNPMKASSKPASAVLATKNPLGSKPVSAEADTGLKIEKGRGSCCKDENSDTADFTALDNGSGETLSPPSSCADALSSGPSLATVAKPTEWGLQSFPPLTASTLTTAAAVAVDAEGLSSHSTVLGAAAVADVKAKIDAPFASMTSAKLARFTTQTMQTIARTAALREEAADSAANSFFRQKASSGVAEFSAAETAAHIVDSEDPIGMRQLYRLPHTLAGSSVSMPSLHRPVACTATAKSAHATILANAAASPTKRSTGEFCMERFAVFYEVALEELMSECEQRMANAPASWRDGQRQFICGDCNRNLATSTLSFDSPRSGVSPVSGHVSQFSTATSSSTGPAYPPCFPNASHNTHGLHTRELSGSLYAASRAIPLSLPAPALQPRTYSFSSAGQVRQAELEKDIPAEETVPALLASLGQHHGKMAPMVFIAALAYLARVTVQCVSELLSITRANWYRLTTTAILIAAKVYDEHSSSRLNAHFARSSGIPLSELTKLELDFLYLIDFDLLLTQSEVEQWLTWMETLAVRRDLMTPLQSYFRHGVESPSAAVAPMMPGTISPATVPLSCAALPEFVEKHSSTTADVRLTARLTNDGVLTDSATVTSPLAAHASRVFTHVRAGGNVASTSNDASANIAPAHQLTGVPEASSAIIPQCGLRSPTLRSPTSFIATPKSLLEAPRSTLSGVSLPGSVTTSVACLRAVGVLPSPIHGVLPACPPPLQTRLFSVVHGKREPPSPRSVRQLSRLDVSFPSAPQPPPMEPNSPVGFFKQPQGGSHGYAHHHAQRTNANAATAAAAAGHGLFGAEVSNAQRTKAPFLASAFAGTTAAASWSNGFSHTEQKVNASGTAHATQQSFAEERRGVPFYANGAVARKGAMAAIGAAAAVAMHSSASAGSKLSSSTTATSGNTNTGSSTRWGPFGMVQQVRDVLGVTASLVRGQLNVLAPAKAPEELKRLPPRAVTNEDTSHNTTGRGGRAGMRSATDLHGGNSGALYGESQASDVDKVNGSSGIGRKSAPAELIDAAPKLPHSPGRCGRRYHTLSPGQNSIHSKTHDPGARLSAAQHADPRASAKAFAQAEPNGGAEVEYGYYDEEGEEEEGEYYEENEYGYYGEDGFYYAYGEEEGYEEEEGDYYYEEGDEEDWYEEESEYFQRCRPPLTHSPPSL